MAHDTHSDDAHAEDAHGGGDPRVESHGPAEFPPAPATRMITPARDDYENAYAGAGLAWPLAWLLVALLLFGAADRGRGEVLHGDHGAAAPAGH